MNRTSVRVTAALTCAATAISLTAGCSRPRAMLTAPASNAPAAERMQAYERLSARGTVSMAGPGIRTVLRGTSRFLALGDGSRVYYPEDLLPVVSADSATARASERSGRARRASNAWLTVAILGISVGATLWVAGIASATNNDGFDDEGRLDDDPVPASAYVGAALALASGLAIFPTVHYRRVARDERLSAFVTYDDSLRGRLALCIDGTRLVDCTAPAPSTPAVAPLLPVPAAAPAASPLAAPPPASTAPAPVPAASPTPPPAVAPPVAASPAPAPAANPPSESSTNPPR